jgi:hypothetical protein
LFDVRELLLPRDPHTLSLANKAPYTYTNTYKADPMQRKLTITIDAEVYEGLHTVVGRRRISRFLSELARPHVVGKDLRAGYAAMAADEMRERDAEAWVEGLIPDVADEPKRHG